MSSEERDQSPHGKKREKRGEEECRNRWGILSPSKQNNGGPGTDIKAVGQRGGREGGPGSSPS